MRKRSQHDPLIDLLATLNPAEERPLTDVERIRSRALLARIKAGEQGSVRTKAAPSRTVPSPWVRVARWAAAPVAALLVVVVVLTVPNDANDGMVIAAPMGGWSASPAVLSTPAASASDAACNAALNALGDDAPDSPPFEIVAEPVVADVRGEWGLIILEGVNRRTGGLVDASCLVWFDVDGNPVVQRVTLDERTLIEDQTALSGEASPQSDVATAQRLRYEFAVGPLAWTTATESLFVDHDGATRFSTLHGRVSDGVVSITLHTERYGDVDVTVTDGWFAVWWPSEWDDRRAPALPPGMTLLDSDGAPMMIGHRPAMGLTVTTDDGVSHEVSMPTWEQGAGTIVIASSG
jgi:hypothetical protein